MSDMERRISRAWDMAGGNRARAAALLERWACTIGALDPTVADDLRRSARRLVRRELTAQGSGNALSRNGRTDWNWRLRKYRKLGSDR